MLPTFSTGTDAAFQVDYPTAAGLTVVSVVYRVTDENGEDVIAQTAVPGGWLADPKINALIPGASNVVPDGRVRTMRTVRFVFAMSNSTEITVTYRYVVEVQDKLTVMGNSFQTIETALMTRMDLPALDGWDNASEQEQTAALVTAHDRICRLTFRYRVSQEAMEWDSINPYWGLYRYVTDMRLRGLDEWTSEFPDDFKVALNRAQLYEADTILGGDPIGDKISQGIVSESTGEAKMFFRNRPPLRHPVGPNCLQVLAPYLYTNNRLTRA
jgi:hypothetical protein